MIIKNRFLRGTLWTVAGTLGVVVLCCLTLLAINWRDRPPSAAALEMQRIFDATHPGAAHHNAAAASSAAAAAPAEQSGPMQALASACGNVGAECLRWLESNEKMIDTLLASSGPLLDQYQRTLRSGYSGDPYPYDARAWLGTNKDQTEGQRLWLLLAWQLAASQDAQTIEDMLSQDLRFWRSVLQSCSYLSSKMIAAAQLKKHFLFGNLVLRRLPAGAAISARPDHWSEALSAEELSMARVWAGEYDYVRLAIADIERSQEQLDLEQLMAAQLFQSQDTSNQQAELFGNYISIMDVPFAGFAAAYAKVQAADQERQDNGIPLSPYNPVGNILFTISAQSYAPYIARVGDVEGIRRLAVLADELRKRGLTKDQVATALRDSDIKAPFSGQPFDWDAAQGSIAFTGLAPAPRNRYSVIY